MLSITSIDLPMAEVLVRDLDPTVVERLKIRARENRRSLQGELKYILEQAVLSSTIDIDTERERIRSMFVGRKFSDSAKLLREDREQ